MYIAEAKKISSWSWKNKNPTWESFVQRLNDKFIRTPETMAEYAALSKDERDRIKALPGCFVGARLADGRRLVQNVACRTLLTLDGDYARKDDWQRFTCIHDDLSVACYPTHSSTPDKPRVRWLLPTSRDMTPDEYGAVARRVAEWIGIETMDASTYDVNRAMYYPSVPKDAPYELRVQWGHPVDVDAVLASYGPSEAWRDVSLWPMSARESAIVRSTGTKAADPTEKQGIVGLFCRTYDVPAAIDAFLPDVYEETATPGRYTYLPGSTAGGAIVYNDGTLLYSNHATDPARGHSCNAFDLVRIHKFAEQDDGADTSVSITKLPSYGAMCAWAAELPEVKRQLAAERDAEAEEAFGDLAEAAGYDQTLIQDGHDDCVAGPDDKDDSWTAQLQMRPKSTDPEPTIDNVRLILQHDKRLRRRIGWNEFSMRSCATDPLPWTPGEKGLRDWTDHDDAGLRCYIEKVWHINRGSAVQDATALVSREAASARHPVREYLNSLTWDGVPRVETMLTDYLGADDTPLNREIAKRWMAAAVRRVMRPGCKFDTILVLVSPDQGIGKSQFADILGGAWFQDGLPQIDSKDAKQALRGAWIVEVSEMAATRKADDEAIKQFFAARTDRYRESYGRYEVAHPRQCVFVGSTNSREFIMDNTGGRRYWPVDVHARKSDVGPRMDRMRGVRDQLWAEAVQLYEKGTPSWFSEPEYLEQLSETQAQHTQGDEWEGTIEAYLEQTIPDDWDSLSKEERRAVVNGSSLRYTDEQKRAWTRRRDEVTIAEIRYELLGEDLSKGAGGSNPSSRHAAKVLNVMPGWKLTTRKTARDFLYGRQKLYERMTEKP